jgi:hypothetical protein
MRSVQRRLLVFVTTLLACDAVSPSGVMTTFLSYSSSPEDPVGVGESRRHAFADGNWQAIFYTDQSVLVTVIDTTQPPAWWWFLRLAAPEGRALVPGTYEGAIRATPFESQSQPGLSFDATGRGCSRLTGRFVILAFALSTLGTVERLHVTFEQRCEGAAAGLTGEISIVADPWR